MSRQRATQSDAAFSEQSQGVGDVTDHRLQIGGWPLDESFPALLTDAHLQRVFSLSPATFYRWKALGRFRRFLVPALAPRAARYSGELVRRYVTGQWTEARTFGAARGPRRIPVLAHRGGESVSSISARKQERAAK